MSQIHSISARGIALTGNDIDTDRIIPARYLRAITFDGLGEAVFIDDRTQTQHPFDESVFQGAGILVVNRNFGCGSSREHAPQALARWGIRAIIGESFAEIFFGNCVAIGIPCLTAAPEVVLELQAQVVADPATPFTIDIEALEISRPDFRAALQMPAGARQMFLAGSWDACGQLLSQAEQIRATATRLPYLGYARTL